MITLRIKDTGEQLGTITDEELAFLVAGLEEESGEDTDYYVDADTVDMLEDDGAPASLVALLRRAVGTGEGVDVQWSRS